MCLWCKNKPDALACIWEVRLTVRSVHSSAAWPCLLQFVLNVLPFDIIKPSGFICIVRSLYHYVLPVKRLVAFASLLTWILSVSLKPVELIKQLSHTLMATFTLQVEKYLHNVAYIWHESGHSPELTSIHKPRLVQSRLNPIDVKLWWIAWKVAWI